MFKQGGGGENERKAVIAGSLPVLIQSVQLKVIATENTVCTMFSIVTHAIMACISSYDQLFSKAVDIC